MAWAIPALAAGTAPAPAPPASDPTAEHDRCVADTDTDPQGALARAKQWSNQGGGFDADHCAAMALFAMKKYKDAAAAFEALAHGMAAAAPQARARVYDQAGQTWLVAEQPAKAKADFDAAINFSPSDPDLFVDRAEALAGMQRYWDAIDDLNHASELAPTKPEVFAYRAAAYRALNSLDLARDDIETNLRLAPNNPIGLLERGNIRRIAGDVAGAKADWQAVVRFAPGSISAEAAAQNLTRLGATRDPAKLDKPKPAAKPDPAKSDAAKPKPKNPS